MLVVAELFNIAVSNFDAKKSAHCSWVLAVPELGCKRNPVYFQEPSVAMDSLSVNALPWVSIGGSADQCDQAVNVN